MPLLYNRVFATPRNPFFVALTPSHPPGTTTSSTTVCRCRYTASAETRVLAGSLPPTPTSPRRLPPRPLPPISFVCDSHYGWAFAGADDPPFVPPGGYGSVSSGAGVVPDPLHGFKTVRQIYEMAVGEGAIKKYTVPLLWDEKVRVLAAFEWVVVVVTAALFSFVSGLGLFLVVVVVMDG